MFSLKVEPDCIGAVAAVGSMRLVSAKGNIIKGGQYCHD
jgi:hypothetical protein